MTARLKERAYLDCTSTVAGSNSRSSNASHFSIKLLHTHQLWLAAAAPHRGYCLVAEPVFAIVDRLRTV